MVPERKRVAWLGSTASHLATRRSSFRKQAARRPVVRLKSSWTARMLFARAIFDVLDESRVAPALRGDDCILADGRVAKVSGEQMRTLSDEDAEELPFAPTVAVEIRSPEDRERNIRTKASLYVATGALLVLDVDPARRRITAFDHRGEQTFADDATFAHEAVPGSVPRRCPLRSVIASAAERSRPSR
jgi:hypothetical protein